MHKRLLLLCICLFLTGCFAETSLKTKTPSISVTAVPERGKTDVALSPFPTAPVPKSYTQDAIVPTLSPTASNIETPMPLITVSITGTPTFYPIQTLSPKQQLDVMDFLNEKPGCKLPCWNGVIPGISSSSELQGFFAKLGYDFGSWNSPEKALEGTRYIELHNFPKGTYASTQLVFKVRWLNGIVNSLGFAYWDHPEQYTIKRIADVLGVPTEIKIAQQQGDFYSLLLLYSEKQLYIQIDGKRLVKRSFNNPLPFDICLDNRDHQDVKALLYSKYDIAGVTTFLGEGWLDWNQLLGISNEDLFQQLQQPKKCFPSP